MWLGAAAGDENRRTIIILASRKQPLWLLFFTHNKKDIPMCKHVIAMLSLSLLFGSASLYAADLENDMDTLKEWLNTVMKIDDAH